MAVERLCAYWINRQRAHLYGTHAVGVTFSNMAVNTQAPTYSKTQKVKVNNVRL